MDILTLIRFFGWCSLINGGLLLLTTFWVMAAPGSMHKLQTKFFPMPRESYDQAMYMFIGLFKIVFLVFNLVPYIALHLIR